MKYGIKRLITGLATFSLAASGLGVNGTALAASTTLPVNLPPATLSAWQPCADAPTRDCATLTVPLDYNHPTAGTTTVAVARAKATDTAHRVGTLLYNPGGPGSSETDVVEFGNLSRTFSPEIAAKFDIVGIDPRGTTNGLSCLDNTAAERYWEADHLPHTLPQASAILNLDAGYNAACVSNNQPLVQHVDTASSIRDIEELRQAMNLPTFTFFGRSYGTFVGYRYNSLYPGHLRAMVLDGVYDRSVPDAQSFAESNVAFDASWKQFVAWCQANTSCQLRGQNIDAVFNQVLAKARTNPIPAPNAPLGNRPVNDWMLTQTVELTTAAGSATFEWADQMIAGAKAGDASLSRFLYDLASGYAGDGQYYGGDGTHRAIACEDTAWSQLLKNPADVQTLMAASQLIAPRYGEANVYQGPAQCYGFSVTPTEVPPLPAKASGVPVLVVGATQDATTPYLWAQRIAGQLVGSRLLTRDGDGHTSYHLSTCVQQKVDRYMVDLTLPAVGTHCATDNNPVQPPPVLGPSAAAAALLTPTLEPGDGKFAF